jgi:hypothetical protein
MKKFLLSVSFVVTAAAAADLPYWIEPCIRLQTGCQRSDIDLARWALMAWQDASQGQIHLVQADRENALLRLVWSMPMEGVYGETVPIRVNGQPGAQINILIQNPHSNDALLRDTIVYLTCLHESGHALGLPHTHNFADIMYNFQYGGDITEYFDRYRRKLKTRDDIRKNPGISEHDRATFLEAIKP